VNRKTLLLVGCSFLTIAGGLLLLVPRELRQPVDLLGPQAPQLLPLTDRAEGGRSQLLQLDRDSAGIHFVHVIDSGFAWPYAGIALQFGQPDSGRPCPDWSRIDTLQLVLGSRHSDGFILGLKTRVPANEVSHPGETWRLVQQTLPASSEIRTYGLARKDFAVPDWWKRTNQLSLLENRSFFGAVCRLELWNTTTFIGLGERDTTTLASLTLIGKTRTAPLPGALLVTLGALLLLLPLIKPRKFGLTPLPLPTRVELPDHEQELRTRVAAYYAAHYMESELPLDRAAREIGLHPKKLQVLLREAFATTHTARVAELRLQEAARLLRESENPVGEIALSVGFGTVSHFNRLFKERFEASPLEFRNRVEIRDDE